MIAIKFPLFFPGAVLSRDPRHGATSKGKALLITRLLIMKAESDDPSPQACRGNAQAVMVAKVGANGGPPDSNVEG